jgi:hypothetical protein
MTQQTKYPFKLANVFFGRVMLERAPKMPEKEIEIGFEVQSRVIEKQLPETLEVHLMFESQSEQPITINLIVIGKFVLTEGATELDNGIIQSFVDERAFHVLWAYADQMVSQVSAQMGMKPIRLYPPSEFRIPQEEPSSST